MNDNEISYRYPGDELTCEPSREVENKCFVGKAFMSLLGSKDLSLIYYDLESRAPNYSSYKLCVIKKNKRLGLLFDNTPILIILAKE